MACRTTRDATQPLSRLHPQSVRKWFSWALAQQHVAHMGFMPNSVRRGGATHAFSPTTLARSFSKAIGRIQKRRGSTSLRALCSLRATLCHPRPLPPAGILWRSCDRSLHWALHSVLPAGRLRKHSDRLCRKFGVGITVNLFLMFTHINVTQLQDIDRCQRLCICFMYIFISKYIDICF